MGLNFSVPFEAKLCMLLLIADFIHILEWEMHILIIYLSPILKRGFRGALQPSLVFSASPNFSVTTHSFTLPASNRPMNVAFVR